MLNGAESGQGATWHFRSSLEHPGYPSARSGAKASRAASLSRGAGKPVSPGRSRSRERLWRKGETSGNTLAVVELRDDCDGDALLVRVRPAGPTCHTGSISCFAPDLWRTISQRSVDRPAGSYTTELLDAGVGACARKVGEEAVELTVAALDESDERVVEEAADLVYHLYVLLAARGLDVAHVDAALAARASAARSDGAAGA